jgi:DNA-directed RNA polymerase subunit omega
LYHIVEGVSIVSIPLDTLIDYEGNIYEITCVAIKEAIILSNPGCGGQEIEENNGKIVSEVLKRALNGEIHFEAPDLL